MNNQITPLRARPPRPPAPAIPPPLKQASAACPVCLGMGFVRRDVPHGHPLFGKALKCACRDAEARRRQRDGPVEAAPVKKPAKRYLIP